MRLPINTYCVGFANFASSLKVDMQAEGSFFDKMMRGVEISSCLHCILYFPHGRILMFAILIPIAFLMLAGKGISEERLQNGMIAGSAKGERQIVAWFAADDVLTRSARNLPRVSLHTLMALDFRRGTWSTLLSLCIQKLLLMGR